MNSKDIYIYATDTVWGIGGSVYCPDATTRIESIKRTEAGKPLSILFSSIDQIYDLFDLKGIINSKWLESFFMMETTIGLSKELLKKDISQSVAPESSFLGIRLLHDNQLSKVIDENGPITTTSLNISGESPICSKKDALNFHKKYCPDTKIIDTNLNPSGNSSTFLIFDHNQSSFKVLREGKNIGQINEHIKIFSA